ncbi:unnamed protein product, partial [Mesorhabditis spiculigera]
MPGVDVTYVLFTIVSSLILLCDIPFIMLIFWNRHLRSHKELVIIGFMCIADASHALATLNSGSVRLWLSVHDLDDIQILNTECIRYVFPVIFLYSYQLMGASTMAVSIDRCIAVMKLGLYRGLTNQFSFVTIAVISCYVISLSSIFIYIIQTGTPTISPWIWRYMLYFRMSTLVLSSLLYLPITARIIQMARSLQRGQPSEIYTKQIIRTTRTIGLTVAAEFLCVVLPDVFLTFNPFGLASWQVVWYICGVSKGVVNVLLVTSRHEEIVKVLQQKFRSLTGQASTGTAVTSMNYRSKN